MINLQDLSYIATILASLVGASALAFASLQLRQSAKIAEGQFMIQLETMMSKHDDIHLNLRNGTSWEPKDKIEWSKVDDYMGFFEHCEILIRNNALQLQNFKHLFEYRIGNLAANQHIFKAKLYSSERADWILFISLCDRLNIK